MSNIKNDTPIPCKVILVGDSGVGKTSIINRYLDKYDPNEKTTIGASFSSKIRMIDGYKISFDIWDTAGEERFRSVNSIFYKEAYVCLIVYDVTNKMTFQNIKNYWYNSVKENANKAITFGIAGNKIDLYSKEEVDEKEVKDYCKEINALFFKTSAKENTFIDAIFTGLGKKFVNSDDFKSLRPKYMDNDNSITIKDNKNKRKNCC